MFFCCLYTAKGIILHSLFILILYILFSDAFEMNLHLDHTDPTPLSGLSIVSSEYDFSWVCCMEVKGRAINTLSENSPLCYWLLVSFSLETDLATETILDHVHPADPTAGQWLDGVGKTDAIFRSVCLMI